VSCSSSDSDHPKQAESSAPYKELGDTAAADTADIAVVGIAAADTADTAAADTADIAAAGTAAAEPVVEFSAHGSSANGS